MSAKGTPVTILAELFLYPMATNALPTTFRTGIFQLPILTKLSTTTFLATTFSNPMAANDLTATFRTVILTFTMATALFLGGGGVTFPSKVV